MSSSTAFSSSSILSLHLLYFILLQRCSETDQVIEERLAQGDPSDQKDEPNVPEEMPVTQMCPQASEDSRGEAVLHPDRVSVLGGEASGGADGGAGAVVLGRQEQMESTPQGEQMDMDSVATTRGR